MDKEGKTEEKKRYNEPFLRAFNYLAGEKMMNQKQLAEVINAESAYISALKSGIKRVGIDYMNRLAISFAKHFKGESHLNMDYLLGKSQYMLVENVPESEMLEKVRRSSNPDYDVMQKQKASTPPTIEQPANNLDISSIFNTALAAKDETITSLQQQLQSKEESLKREIQSKDEIIQSLREQLRDKENLIAEQKARLIDYRRIIDSNVSTSNWPFPIGAADQQNNKRAKI